MLKITEVRIKLMREQEGNERLLAFASLVIEGVLAVRDLRIIDGAEGWFVAMPSRKITDTCRCGERNHLLANFCNRCGDRLASDRAKAGEDGRLKIYADVAHPIRTPFREELEKAVLRAYRRECLLAKYPGYVCRYREFDEEVAEGDKVRTLLSKPRGMTDDEWRFVAEAV